MVPSHVQQVEEEAVAIDAPRACIPRIAFVSRCMMMNWGGQLAHFDPVRIRVRGINLLKGHKLHHL